MHDQVDGAPEVGCIALDYMRHEALFDSEQERADDKYSGYYIVMMGDVISDACVPIGSDA